MLHCEDLILKKVLQAHTGQGRARVLRKGTQRSVLLHTHTPTVSPVTPIDQDPSPEWRSNSPTLLILGTYVLKDPLIQVLESEFFKNSPMVRAAGRKISASSRFGQWPLGWPRPKYPRSNGHSVTIRPFNHLSAIQPLFSHTLPITMSTPNMSATPNRSETHTMRQTIQR